MGTITVSKRIEAPPADVYAAITDLEGAAERISAITALEILSDGPFDVGTRSRETRTMFKRECTEVMWITEVEPGRGYSTEARSNGYRYACRLWVEPDGTGSVLSMSMNPKAETFMAKLMWPVCLLFSGMVRKCFEQDLQDIQASLEGPAAGAVTA